ncbi:hypothetical protein [EBPR podovirus 3]|nr:hypothetical protein [EBPR podovirus 3]
MEMHNIKDNPDAMKEIAKEMKKAAKKKKIIEPVDCWFGETLVTFTKIIINERAYFYITPKKPHPFIAGYYSIRSDIYLRKTNSPYAVYLIDELIEIVKSGDFSFC